MAVPTGFSKLPRQWGGADIFGLKFGLKMSWIDTSPVVASSPVTFTSMCRQVVADVVHYEVLGDLAVPLFVSHSVSCPGQDPAVCLFANDAAVPASNQGAFPEEAFAMALNTLADDSAVPIHGEETTLT